MDWPTKNQHHFRVQTDAAPRSVSVHLCAAMPQKELEEIRIIDELQNVVRFKCWKKNGKKWTEVLEAEELDTVQDSTESVTRSADTISSYTNDVAKGLVRGGGALYVSPIVFRSPRKHFFDRMTLAKVELTQIPKREMYLNCGNDFCAVGGYR